MNSSATTTSTIANPPSLNSGVYSHISSEKMLQTSNKSPSPPQLFPQMQKLSQSNQSQDVLFKIFTYTIIILPTLTSILFPIKTTMPPSEHAGNLIIDLLTVLLLSLVVKHTIEWPYNWLRQLQKTKVMLLQDMNRENTDKTILLVRKIYTFEIIALISCLVSCIFSSILLIWTRQYTIIDQKRKKVVFNNVNIALLQFWSLFRVIITFTDSLQQSSMHTNHLSWETPQLKNWYQDLSHYFLPNASNQILLDHLQQHNRQFDQLKMDLISLQNELEEKKSLSNDSRESSFTPFPLNMSPTLLSPNPSVNLSPTNSRNYVSFPFKAPPSSELPVSSPPVPKRKSSTMKSSSKKSQLNTIIEEDDSTLYDSKENTFTNFDEIIPGIGITTRPPTLLDEIRSMVTSVRREVSFLDIIKHPNAVCNLLLKEFAPLLNHNFELGEYDIVRIVATEIFNNYLHRLVHDIREELGKYWNYPLYFVKKAVIFFALRLPIYAILLYFRVLFYVPWVLFRMLVLEPIVQIGNLMLMVFKFALLTITTMTPKLTMSAPVLTSSPFPSPLLTPSSYSSSLSSSLPPSPKTSEKSSKIIIKKSQKKLSHSNQKKLVVVPRVAKETVTSKFAMKPFHLSPILADLMTFENGVNNNYNNNNHTRSRKKINLQSIDTIPEEPNTISGGKKHGRFYKYSNSLALYDD